MNGSDCQDCAHLASTGARAGTVTGSGSGRTVGSRSNVWSPYRRAQRVSVEWSLPRLRRRARRWPLGLRRCPAGPGRAAAKGRESEQEEDRAPGEAAVAVPPAVVAPPPLPSVVRVSAVPRAAPRCASRSESARNGDGFLSSWAATAGFYRPDGPYLHV